jgi:hypothetical protein
LFDQNSNWIFAHKVWSNKYSAFTKTPQKLLHSTYHVFRGVWHILFATFTFFLLLQNYSFKRAFRHAHRIFWGIWPLLYATFTFLLQPQKKSAQALWLLIYLRFSRCLVYFDANNQFFLKNTIKNCSDITIARFFVFLRLLGLFCEDWSVFFIVASLDTAQGYDRTLYGIFSCVWTFLCREQSKKWMITINIAITQTHWKWHFGVL